MGAGGSPEFLWQRGCRGLIAGAARPGAGGDQALVTLREERGFLSGSGCPGRRVALALCLGNVGVK